ncbi:MAG: sodium:solute symporter [Luminiphilus sp.]|jgi:SSS family transporter|tara:strand:- start:273 stop:1709 length:1437 start_codon:yes stop_codon:yes gene_type:complete
MSWFVEHWIASSLLVIYVSVLFHNAYVGNKAATGVGGYYVGNRQLGGTVVGISFFATFASTNTFIGHAGKGYDYGVAWFTMAVLLVIFSWISWRWIGPPLRRFAAAWDALTIPDYIRGRILGNNPDAERHPLLLLSASVIVFASILYLLAIFKGAGHLFQIFLGVPYEVAVGVTLLVVVLYTSIGGFVSVIRTDAIQGVLMLIGAMTIFYFVTQAAGGVTSVAQLTDMPAKEHLFDLNGAVPFAVLLGVSLSGALKLIVDPRQLSRFYGLKSDAEVKRGMWIAVLGMTLILACMFPIGLYAHLILDNVTDTDLIVPRLVNDPAIFPFWVTDLLIVSIVSAAMSSMDSVLLVASSTLYKNIIAPFKAIENEVRWSRAAVIGFACVSAFMALNPPGDIVGITIFSGSLYAVCFFPPVVFGLYGRIASARTTLMSMILGMSTLILWITLGLSSLLHEVFPALLMSASVYWFQSGKETTTKI